MSLHQAVRVQWSCLDPGFPLPREWRDSSRTAVPAVQRRQRQARRLSYWVSYRECVGQGCPTYPARKSKVKGLEHPLRHSRESGNPVRRGGSKAFFSHVCHRQTLSLFSGILRLGVSWNRRVEKSTLKRRISPQVHRSLRVAHPGNHNDKRSGITRQ